MSKLGIDMLNAYPTISNEEQIELKGGIAPLAAAAVAGKILQTIATVGGIIVTGIEIYNFTKGGALYGGTNENENTNSNQIISSYGEKMVPDVIINGLSQMIGNLQPGTEFSFSCDSITVKGVYAPQINIKK